MRQIKLHKFLLKVVAILECDLRLGESTCLALNDHYICQCAIKLQSVLKSQRCD